MKIFRILYFILFMIYCAICSCNESKRPQVYGNISMDFYESGTIKCINIKNGLTQNSQVVWIDSTGNIQYLEKKKDTVRNGQTVWFYENGNIENTTIFSNGKRSGASFMFYEDGEIKNHRYWRNGKRLGYASDYLQDSIGTLKNVYFYDSDTIQWWQPAAGKGISVQSVH